MKQTNSCSEVSMRIRELCIALCLASALFVLPAQPVQAAKVCFAETNQCMYGRIADYWNRNGGLSVFGYPIGPEEATIIDGNTFFTQRFERNTLELHPENAPPYDVLLGRLGAERLTQQQRNWFTFPKDAGTSECVFFAETGFGVCGAVLDRWRASGIQLDKNRAISAAESLALFGLPLSGLMTETLSDGKQYQVQWFERARFELHPENPAPYNVLLGLLGNETTGWRADSPVRMSVPSRRFAPFPEFAVTAHAITSVGYPLRDWTQSWYVNPRFYDDIPQRDGMKQFKSTFNREAVQLMLTSAVATTQSGSQWDINIGLAEFETIYDAKVYYDMHHANELFSEPRQNEVEQYLSRTRCDFKWAPGLWHGQPTLSVFLQCRNKVANVTIGGWGQNTELAWLMDYLVTFYSNKF